MAQTPLGWRKLGWSVYLALALLLIFAVAFVIEVVALQEVPPNQAAEPVSAQSYRVQVDALLKIAHPEDAEAVVESLGCVACHRTGAANGIAPSWVGIAARAATRRPPMPADAYIYESITNPSAYVVSGYTDVMPKDFARLMSAQQLADVIAYLLTPDAH